MYISNSINTNMNNTLQIKKFTLQSNTQSDNKFKNIIKGNTKILAGCLVGYKGFISGFRRILGIRIEEHTTTYDNAKKIIESGLILNPKYGGTGASQISPIFQKNSKGFVHITGIHKDFKTVYKCHDSVKNKFDILFFNEITRKKQNLLYRLTTMIQCKSKNKYQRIKEVFKAKTFYVGGTDNYFNSNFIPDSNALALKTTDCVKVTKTKLGAFIQALKREGLSGIKQNKIRVILGAVISLICSYTCLKLIKNGLKDIKNEH